MPATYTPDWSDLTNVPTEFADGTDEVNDTVDWSEISGIVGTTASTVAEGDHNHDAAYLPLSAPAAGITSTQITNWDAAYGWGDHSAAGYLTGYTETDPVFLASTAYGIDSTDVTNWDAAYGWGDHDGYTRRWVTITTRTTSMSPATR